MKDAALLAEIARRLRAAAPELLELLLFGSYARGEATPSSDVDLVLIVDEACDRGATLKRARRALLGLGVGFDLVMMTRSQWVATASSAGSIWRKAAGEAVRIDMAA